MPDAGCIVRTAERSKFFRVGTQRCVDVVVEQGSYEFRIVVAEQ